MQSPQGVVLTVSNVGEWPAFQRLLAEGKVVADRTGRLRYPHGAPVGRMVPVRAGADGAPRYREAADEWFDPDSPRARAFVWPRDAEPGAAADGGGR